MSMFKAEYQDFKREDPTVVVKVTLYDDNKQVIKPNISKGKLVKQGRNAGEYNIIQDGDQYCLSTKQVEKLPSGDYGLELWAENGAIFPSAGFIPVRIHRNADDSLSKIDPTLDLNEIIEDLHHAGLNVVFDSIEMLDENAEAQITSEVRDGKNHISLKIPRGKQGNVGPAPTLKIGTVTKLNSDQTPTANVSGDNGAYTLDLGIPQGAQGETDATATQAVITYLSDVTYKINSDGTMLVTFVKNDQNQVVISYPGVQKTVPVEASYTLNSSEALVYNSVDNSLAVLNFDSLLPDSLILIANYHGNVIKNNINAVQGDGNYKYYLDGTENVIYYASTVTAKRNGEAIDVNFDQINTGLYYKDSAGNHAMSVPKSMYTVPHNFSLVLNRETKSLEVINTDNIIRGVHSILITCHHGLAKKVGMHFDSLPTGISALPTSGKIPINRYRAYIGGDATKVGNEYWLFEGSTPDHTSTAPIHRINPTDFSEIGLITHNLGHANGVDYRDNTLLVYNGSGLPPEINLYKNPDNTMTNLKIQDAANTQIIFKEGSKLLPGDGSACFGLDNKIVYYAYCYGHQVIILKILLGLGDNDLSDKTTDKSDNQHWGNFVSGKSQNDYNGTAQIITSYAGDILGNNQPQGMAFDGDLYIATSHSEQKAYQIRLLDDGSYKVVDTYKSEMTDYKNNVIGLEPEITFIDPEKRSVFVGGVGTGVSNVAEFYL